VGQRRRGKSPLEQLSLQYCWAIAEVFGIPPYDQRTRLTGPELEAAAAYIDRMNEAAEGS
jgi:hypothetical protein